MKKDDTEKKPKRDDEVILLEDLAPRKDVKGGAKKVPFGQQISNRGGRRKP
jgi:hypothetical protein